MVLYEGDVFVVVVPINNKKKVKYYLMQFIERKIKLLEDYYVNGFIYERGYVILKGCFFKKPIKLRVMFTFKTIILMS